MIRRAEPGDFDRLIDLVAALARHHRESASVTTEWLRTQCFEAAAPMRALVAERDDQIVGYALGFFIFTAHAGQKLLEIHHLYVAPDFRRRGIGRDLIQAMAALARKESCHGVRLGVMSDNHDAQEFYEAVGLTPSLSRHLRYRMRF